MLENNIPLHALPALTVVPVGYNVLGLRGPIHSVNKGATYKCKSPQILNTETAVEVITEQQWCVSPVAPRPAVYNFTVQASCVKEIDGQAASDQQLPPQAMHTPYDVPIEQPRFLSLNLQSVKQWSI